MNLLRLVLSLFLIGIALSSATCRVTSFPVSRSATEIRPTVFLPVSTSTPSPIPVTLTPMLSLVTPTPTQTPSLIPATPTVLPLPARVFEKGRRETRTRPQLSEFEDFRLKGQIIAQTAHFDFYADQGYFPVAIDEFKKQAEVVFDYVSARLKTSSEQKIALSFRPPMTIPCPARGLAMPGKSPPRIFIMADEQTGQTQILGVLAHEVGHILHAESDLSRGNLALSEGLATWAAGDYWNTWQGMPSLDIRIKSYLTNSTYLPLYENYDLLNWYPEPTIIPEDCLTRRDILYTEWATFIDYLIAQYGWEKLHALFESPSVEDRETEVIVTPPDFEGVYGSSLNQLEAAWLRQLVNDDDP